jgi:thymidylate synthase
VSEDQSINKSDRTGTGTKSLFGVQFRHSMSDGFPLLTTKKMAWKTMVVELLWFLRGETNIKFLLDYDCHIWDGDAYKNYSSNVQPWEPHLDMNQFIERIKNNEEFKEKWGDLGPIYGNQWRDWGGKLDVKLSDEKDENGFFKYDSTHIPGIDQIQNLINELKTNPDSRRLMVSAWNPSELDQMVLPPCHYGFQVYTRELSNKERYRIWFNRNYETGMEFNDELIPDFDDKYYESTPTRAISLMWNQRSVDTFLGLPFNIASYGLLLEIIAKEVNMVPEELIGNLGDVHLYSNHIEQAKEQIGRKYTHEERTELLKQAMGEENYNKAVDELMPFGGGLSEYFGKYNISPGLHTRKPFPLPTLKFSPCPITGISMEYQSIAQFQIENYESHPTIKAPLSN